MSKTPDISERINSLLPIIIGLGLLFVVTFLLVITIVDFVYAQNESANYATKLMFGIFSFKLQ